MIDTTRGALLRAIEEYSRLYPEERLGQLIANLVEEAREPRSQAEVAAATWDVEDSELLDTIRGKIGRRAAPPEGQVEAPAAEDRGAINFHETWIELLRLNEEFADRHPDRSSARHFPKGPNWDESARKRATWGEEDEEFLATLREYLGRHSAGRHPETIPAHRDDEASSHGD